MVALSRILSLAYALIVAALAAVLSAQVYFADGEQALDYLRIFLLALSAAWIGWGAALAFGGLLSPPRRKTPPLLRAPHEEALTAVLVPVYNEDPVKTFSNVAAMIHSLDTVKAGHRFHFCILSDTRSEDIAALEEQWFDRLNSEWGAICRLFYRRREKNTGRKAGNIADFIRTSGGAYEFLVILDADSLMQGATLVEMTRRMEDDPKLGLLQTLPKIIHADSWFGRSIQFAANFYSLSFARGLANTQGREGPFWGHNAIVRTRAFAESCGLPELPGKPPFGGHILSHDYVEAALLARNDWTVAVDPELGGSYEESPENIIDFAKRDRRWCQGNLQHTQLIGAPGLKAWNRFTLAQGVMSYLASPIWLAFIIVTMIGSLNVMPPDYFPTPHAPAVFPRSAATEAFALILTIVGLLIGPKLLIVLRGGLTGEGRGFGRLPGALWSTLVEILWSSIFAPIMLMYQTRSVIQVLTGADSGWPAANRDADAVGFREAWAAAWWISLTGAVVLAATWFFAPQLFYWFLPISLPQLLSPFLIMWSSRPSAGRAAFHLRLFRTPQEQDPSYVVRAQETIYRHWRKTGADSRDKSPIQGGPGGASSPRALSDEDQADAGRVV